MIKTWALWLLAKLRRRVKLSGAQSDLWADFTALIRSL